MLARYLPTLRRLVATGAPFVVVGSCALELHGHALAGLGPRDCDLACDLDHIAPLLDALTADDWDLRVWDEPLRRPFAREQLAGKFYARATADTRSIDLDFELAVPFTALWAQRVELGGVPVAALAHVIAMKQARSSPRDLAQLAQVLRR